MADNVPLITLLGVKGMAMSEHTSETYRSLISISMEGLKTLLLINGGAVVALLAYLGQSPQGPRLAPHV